MLEVGRVCLKTAGREAGRYCIVLKKMDENFVLVTGPKETTKVKRRRCNIEHLEPLMEKIKIAAEASDSEVMKEFSREGLYEKLGIKKPDTESLKRIREEKAKRKAKAKPRPEKKVRQKPRKEKPKEKESAKKAEPKPEPRKAEKKAKPAKKSKPKKKK